MVFWCFFFVSWTEERSDLSRFGDDLYGPHCWQLRTWRSTKPTKWNMKSPTRQEGLMMTTGSIWYSLDIIDRLDISWQELSHLQMGRDAKSYLIFVLRAPPIYPQEKKVKKDKKAEQWRWNVDWTVIFFPWFHGSGEKAQEGQETQEA